MREIFRQGDVLLVEVTEEPTGKEIPRDKGRVVLAYGEVTGHAHAISHPGAKLYVVNKNLRLLKLEDPAVLQHEEHAPIQLPAKTFQVIQQRERDIRGVVRVVAD